MAFNRHKSTTHKQPRTERRRDRRKYRQLLMAVIMFSIIGWLVHEIAAPVHGHLIQADHKLQAIPAHQKQQSLPASNLTNDYYNLALPPGYSVQPASQSVPGLLYQQTIIKPASLGSLIINVAVKNLPSGGLSTESSYQSRLQQAGRYQINAQSIGGDQIMITNDQQSASVVAFWLHDGYLATISVASGLGNPAEDGNHELLQALSPLLAAWSWH